MKLKKGDMVRVLQGKDRGKEGQIMRAFPAKGMVIVDGVNVAKKSQRATKATMQGGIIDKDMPVPVSVVAIVCPACKKPSRVGYRTDDRGAKVRVCRRCRGDI